MSNHGNFCSHFTLPQASHALYRHGNTPEPPVRNRASAHHSWFSRACWLERSPPRNGWLYHFESLTICSHPIRLFSTRRLRHMDRTARPWEQGQRTCAARTSTCKNILTNSKSCQETVILIIKTGFTSVVIGTRLVPAVNHKQSFGRENLLSQCFGSNECFIIDCTPYQQHIEVRQNQRRRHKQKWQTSHCAHHDGTGDWYMARFDTRVLNNSIFCHRTTSLCLSRNALQGWGHWLSRNSWQRSKGDPNLRPYTKSPCSKESVR